MGIPTPADQTAAVTGLDDEVEGDIVPTKNYCFSIIGKPVPVMIRREDASADPVAIFDPKSVPYSPVALSLRFRLVFVVHPKGFCVTRTLDVISAAKSMKDGGKCQAIEEFCLVNVPMENISVITLSCDEALLAVCVGNKVHFFAVSALLHKDQKPSFSVSLDGTHSIKSMIWAKRTPKDYVVLSSDGKLYHGSCQGSHNLVMEGVDCVDWSAQENYVVAAKKNIVIILSHDLVEKFRFLLPFKSVIDDSDGTEMIKVDSIRWIRPDCIAVGCLNSNDDGLEGNYFVQFITSNGSSLKDIDESSKPSVISYDDIMLDSCLDVPDMNGMHLLLSYLEHYGVAFISIRNLSRQVGLICWPPENGNNAALVEILDDSWNCRIEYEDYENNAIVGLAVDKLSQDENARFSVGDTLKEVAPCCVLVCLTIDGTVYVYHFVSAAGASSLQEGHSHNVEDDTCDANKSKTPQVSLEGKINSVAGILPLQKGHGLDVDGTGDSNKGLPPHISSVDIITSSADDLQSQEVHGLKEGGDAGVSNKFDMPQRSSLGSERKTGSPFSTFEHSEGNITQLGRTGSKASTKNDLLLSRSSVTRNPPSKYPDSQVINSSAASRKPFQQEFRKELTAPSFASGSPYSLVQAPRNLGNVEEVTRSLDNLLQEIEEKGGFTDLSISSQADSIKQLEDNMWALSDRCRTWKGLMVDKLMETRLLLDKTVEVMTRKINMEAIFRQALDSRYQELWDGQELSHEMESKLQSIMQGEQVLTNQLIELERHFNTLEFNKLGEDKGLLRNQMALKNLARNSRQIKSLQSLQSTMHAQIETAENLAGSLSEQMACLRIESSEKPEVLRQICEAVGLQYSATNPSPAVGMISSTPVREHRVTSIPLASREGGQVNQDRLVSNNEPKSARRQRYSLDQSWTSADPPKTTMKRMLEANYETAHSHSVTLGSDKQHLSPDLQKKSEMRAHHTVSRDSSGRFRDRGATGWHGQHFNENSTDEIGLLDPRIKAPSALRSPALPVEGIRSVEAPTHFLSIDKTSKSNVPSSGKIESIIAVDTKRGEKSTFVPHSLSTTFRAASSPGISVAEYKEAPLLHGKLSSTFSFSSHSSLLSSQSNLSPESSSLRAPSSETLSSLSRPLSVEFDSKIESPSLLKNIMPLSPETMSNSTIAHVSQEVSTISRLPLKAKAAPSSASSLWSAYSTPDLGGPATSVGVSESPTTSIALSSEPLSSTESTLNVVSGSKIESPSLKNVLPLSPPETVSSSPVPQEVPLISEPHLKPITSPSAPSLWSANSVRETPGLGNPVTSAHVSEPPITSAPSTVDSSHGKVPDIAENVNPDQVEEMEEEAPETSRTADISLGGLDSFGIGSKSNSTSQNTKNPFGVTLANTGSAFATFPSYSMPSSGGDLFRPASFNFASSQPSVASQPTPAPIISNAISGQSPGAVGFGQPSSVGVGQQAMGKVFGAFGQSSQLGSGLPGSGFPATSSFGGSPGGGSAVSGGFAGLSSGFGGFAGAAGGGRGFVGAATSSQVSGGGFGGFSSNQQVSGGFSAFGGNSGAVRPPELFTQMRK